MGEPKDIFEYLYQLENLIKQRIKEIKSGLITKKEIASNIKELLKKIDYFSINNWAGLSPLQRFNISRIQNFVTLALFPIAGFSGMERKENIHRLLELIQDFRNDRPLDNPLEDKVVGAGDEASQLEPRDITLAWVPFKVCETTPPEMTGDDTQAAKQPTQCQLPNVGTFDDKTKVWTLPNGEIVEVRKKGKRETAKTRIMKAWMDFIQGKGGRCFETISPKTSCEALKDLFIEAKKEDPTFRCPPGVYPRAGKTEEKKDCVWFDQNPPEAEDEADFQQISVLKTPAKR